jgi:hypothetical protein
MATSETQTPTESKNKSSRNAKMVVMLEKLIDFFKSVKIDYHFIVKSDIAYVRVVFESKILC